MKVECVFPEVIWSEFRLGQYRDDDHREGASYFNTISTINTCQILTNQITFLKLFPTQRVYHQLVFLCWSQNSIRYFSTPSRLRKKIFPFFSLMLVTNVGDETCWRRNMLVTTLRCWWPIYNIEKVNNMTKKVTNIMILSPTHHCSRENLHCIWSWDVEGDRAFPNRHLLTDLVSPEINYN